jgi:hypothetical protein
MAFDALVSLQLAQEDVAIALTTSALAGSHIGIAFVQANGDVEVTQLAFDQLVRTEQISALKDCWIGTVVEIPQPAGAYLAAIVRQVALRKPPIRYGINFLAARGSFQGPEYAPPPNSDGLTCASFVAELFRAVSLPLVNDSTWEEDDENLAWGQKVVAMLQQHKVHPDHIADVQKNISKLRLQPQELGAAGDAPFADRPMGYAVAHPGGTAVMKELTRLCPEANLKTDQVAEADGEEGNILEAARKIGATLSSSELPPDETGKHES